MSLPVLDTLRRQLESLDVQALRRVRRTVVGACATERLVLEPGPSRRLLAFCSNDYLGLAAHPAVVEALARGAHAAGAGSGASALISGHHAAHERLEARLAALLEPHIPACRSLFFGTGYLANLATLSALADDQTTIFSEALNHASLIDGVRLSGAPRRIYPHADLSTLEQLLRTTDSAHKLIVTDAVFSMDGALAPLPELLALAQRYAALLVVDDAHGFGVLGAQGRGSLAHFGLRSEHLVLIGTLGKALGVAGAFVAAHPLIIEWLIQRARPYVFSTAPPPALAWALEAALDVATGPTGADLRAVLAGHVQRLRTGLRVHPWRLLPSQTPIQSLIIGANAPTMAAAAALSEAGIWVPGIRPPTVAAGTGRLRVTLSAAHQPAQVDRLVAELNRVAQLPAGA